MKTIDEGRRPKVIALLQDLMGFPGTLARDLADRPVATRDPAPAMPGIGLDSVARWDRMSQSLGVGYRSGQRHHLLDCSLSPPMRRSEPLLEALVERTEVQDWSCDIRDVDGVSASKSDLRTYLNLDDLAERSCPELIGNARAEDLAAALAHRGIRIGRRPAADTRGDGFVRYDWDGRLFLVNSDGSHHFAAARFIAGRLGQHVELHGPLTTYSLRPTAVHDLCARYRTFSIARSDLARVERGLAAAGVGYLVGGIWCHGLPPSGEESARTLWLAQANERARRAATALERSCVDVGSRLAEALRRQSQLPLAEEPSEEDSIAAEEAPRG